MPEISEVKLTSEFITNANKERYITDVTYLKTNKLKLIEDVDVIKAFSAVKTVLESILYIWTVTQRFLNT